MMTMQVDERKHLQEMTAVMVVAERPLREKAVKVTTRIALGVADVVVVVAVANEIPTITKTMAVAAAEVAVVAVVADGRVIATVAVIAADVGVVRLHDADEPFRPAQK